MVAEVLQLLSSVVTVIATAGFAINAIRFFRGRLRRSEDRLSLAENIDAIRYNRAVTVEVLDRLHAAGDTTKLYGYLLNSGITSTLAMLAGVVSAATGAMLLMLNHPSIPATVEGIYLLVAAVLYGLIGYHTSVPLTIYIRREVSPVWISSVRTVRMAAWLEKNGTTVEAPPTGG